MVLVSNSRTAPYTFQPLPDLGSLQRNPAHDALRLSLPLPSSNSTLDTTNLRAAFTATLMRYIDSTDFVLAESDTDYLLDPEGVVLRVFRAQMSHERSWESFSAALERGTECCVDDVRLELMLSERTNPVPAVFVWDVASYADKDIYPASGIVFGAHVDEEDGGVFVDVLADRALISASSLSNFLSLVIATYTSITASPSSPCTTPPALPQHLLSISTSETDPSHEKVVLEWLFENAANRPDAIAHEVYASLERGPEVVTYGELNESTNVLARWLVSRGVGVEDKVCLCSVRNRGFYVAMAAILKAGACYVSIDIELPDERKKFIEQDSEAKFVLVTDSEAGRVFARPALVTDDLLSQARKEHGNENICLAGLDNLAYLLYTSGTTGNPKGCLLEHRGLYWAMESFCALPRPITNPDTDKRLSLASTAFDVHISEIVQSWCLGTRLVSAPRFELLTNLRTHVVELGITHVGMVPSMIEALLVEADGLGVKYLVSGGEKITDALLQKWSNRDDLLLANFYGPTEATIGCTSRRVGPSDRKENIGRPFPSCGARVLDKNLDVVPVGCPGELVVSGPLVARGYHHLPEATAKAFMRLEDGTRAYRTGDLVRMMPDNSIEIMGRIDHQVKYRGVRIETEGISSILTTASKAATKEDLSALTFITSHPQVGGELLVSFVAPASSKSVSVEERRNGVPRVVRPTAQWSGNSDSEEGGTTTRELIRALKRAVEEQLPPYMRPAYIVPVEYLPLTLNGKTDRKKLERVFGGMGLGELMGAQGGK
ncbi:unnamed protein product [Peniophora sp. CBMAI 1063]|nr:unnamed protein product [Peniophora sp. CBMAI 1063]